MRARVVVLEAVSFGVADQVEPVAAPAFAIARVGEQTISASHRPSASIVEERVGLFGPGWNANEVGIDAAQQRDFTRGRALAISPLASPE